MHKNSIHDGISIQWFKNIEMSFSENSKELHDKTLRLVIIEYIWVIMLVEEEIKLRIINNLLDFADVEIIVHVLKLKTKS